ncbi:MAG: M14 family zinc carboxypeptidase [Bacteroidota bacterium]
MKRACNNNSMNIFNSFGYLAMDYMIIAKNISNQINANLFFKFKCGNLYRFLYLIIVGFLVFFNSCAERFETPTASRDYAKPASSEEVVEFSKFVSENCNFLSDTIIGQTTLGKDLIAVRAALPEAETDTLLKVLLFAQQHGNEQSSKEALLLLISNLHKYEKWLKNMEVWIVPQVNPEGSDLNQRRNSLGIDLNRDHVLKVAPETRALHSLFNEIMPHVTVDIHEYNPYRESWENFGGYKNFDVQVGIPTNINVDEKIRSFALNRVLPALEEHLNVAGYSFHNYLVGPVPTNGLTRHSTVDINDGRQSFAILNTLSFIYEGINGKDAYVENLERRTHGQYEAIKALLNILDDHSCEVKQMVEESRGELYFGNSKSNVAIRMEHIKSDVSLLLPLTSSKTGKDTVVEIIDFHPLVISKLEVEKPEAYLVPANDTLLRSFLDLHKILYFPAHDIRHMDVTLYKILNIETSIDENLENRFPEVEIKKIKGLKEKYIYVPTAQLHSNFLVLLLEPQSMLGLAQRKGFEYLLKENEVYPIYRVN